MNFLHRLFFRISDNLKISFFLGAGLGGKLRLFFISTWLSLRKRLRFTGEINYKVRLKKFDQVFYCDLKSYWDIQTLKSVFVNEEYKLNRVVLPDIILDLGSNVGYSAIYFRLRYPDAEIYCFEPDINNYTRLNKNLVPFDKMHTFHLAVSSVSGEVNFFANRQKGISSSFLKRNVTESPLKINSKTLKDIILDLNIKKIDLLKFDIEGAEGEIFKDPTVLGVVKHFVGEVHPELLGIKEEEFLNNFKDFKLLIKKKNSGKYVIEGYRL